VAAHSQRLGPERHDLHEPDGAGVGDGVAIEVAFDLHDGHDEAGRDLRFSRAIRFAEHGLEDQHALFAVRHALAQPRFHHLVPDGGIELVLETLGLIDRVLHGRLELGLALRFGRRRTEGQRRQQQE
jgi:hypothetical protein